jgi:SPP1 gp7 family putative phage head morphogenesis protein
VPQHEFDLRITDHYAPLLSRALRDAFPASLLEAAVAHVAGAVVKAASPEQDFLRAAARAALGAPNMDAVDQVLRQVFADAYGAGGYAAAQQLGGGAAVSSLAGVSSVDWAGWKPGDPAASGLLSNGGLQQLLDGAGVTVRGISGSLVDQLGNAIADGVMAGTPHDRVARDLVGIVGSSSRAEMIAHTETARAVTAATMDTYAANGVQQWDWVLSSGACPRCVGMAEQNPHRVGAEAPPGHPRCRCAASPVVSSVTGGTGSAGLSGPSLLSGGDLGAAFDSAAADAAAADTAAADAAASEEAGAAEAGAVEDLTGLSDDDLAGMLATEDPAQLDRVLAELDRRDAVAAQERAAAEKKAAQAARRDAKAAALEADRNARLDEAIARGEDPEEAFAEIWGKDLERVRIQSAMRSLRAQGYTGRNYEELCMSQFKEYADRAYLDAENATRGALLNKAGMQAGINPRTLFTGQDVRARKWASEELLGYWQQTGRLTLSDFKAANLGQAGTASTKAYYL